ncbi:JAB domain-containing protein, partial [Pseudomonas gingeri]
VLPFVQEIPMNVSFSEGNPPRTSPHQLTVNEERLAHQALDHNSAAVILAHNHPSGCIDACKT